MAFPTDFSDVSTDDIITASRNNAITKKIGLTSIATDATTGHFSLPRMAGVPTGDPVNGAGSMVWDNSNNELYINEDGSAGSWAEIGGGGSSAFTEAVTIDLSTGVGLTIDQSGTGKIADLKGDGTSRFSLDDDGIVNAKAVDLKNETGFNIEGTRDLDGGTTIAFLRVGEGATNLFRVGLYGFYKIDMFAILYLNGNQIYNSPHWLISNSGLKIWKSPASDAFEMVRGADGDSMTLDLGGTTKSWLEVKDGKLKETSGDETMFDFSGTVDKAGGNYTAFKMNVTENTAGGTANLLLDLQVGGSTVFNISDTGVFAINSSDPALTISQSGAGDILDLQDGGNSAFTVDEHGAIYSYPQVGSTAMVVQGYGTDSYDIFKILDSPPPDYGGNTLFSVSQAGVNETHLNTMKVFVKRNLIIESGTGSIFFTDGWTNGIAIYAKTYDGSNNSAVMELDHENNGQGRFAIVDGSEAAMIEFTGRTGVGYTPEIEVHQLIRSEDDNPLVDDALGQMQGLVTATKTINHDTTTATMITIPAGSIIRKCYFRVGATAFDGTFTVDFGNGTTADGYLATAKITEGTTGLYGINEDDRGALLWDGTLQVGDYSASAITVVATIDGGGASEGSGVLYIQYERVH